MKFILLIALVGAVLWWAFGRQRPAAASKAGRQSAPRIESMVRCAHCGVHLPRGEAVGEGAALFCSESHRALGSRS